jgi:hypothetical protein
MRKQIDVVESKINNFLKFYSPRGTFCVFTIFFLLLAVGETGWEGERNRWTRVGFLAMDALYGKGHESLEPYFAKQNLV